MVEKAIGDGRMMTNWQAFLTWLILSGGAGALGVASEPQCMYETDTWLFVACYIGLSLGIWVGGEIFGCLAPTDIVTKQGRRQGIR